MKTESPNVVLNNCQLYRSQCIEVYVTNFILFFRSISDEKCTENNIQSLNPVN